MRTKQVDGVLRLDIMRLDVKPEVYLCYDGLGGLSQRPILRDMAYEMLERTAPRETFGDLILAMRRTRKGGEVHVYFHDYVSYGIGGGDATAEFFFGRLHMSYDPPRVSPTGEPLPEQLLLKREGGWERLELDPSWLPVSIPLPGGDTLRRGA